MLCPMKPINWNSTKNQQLISERGISFEDVVFYLGQDALLDDFENPNSGKYPNQRLFVINIDNYAYLILYVGLESTTKCNHFLIEVEK